MPVKINEVIIRAVIDAQSEQAGTEPGAAPAGLTEQEKQELVQSSVNEVLRILDRKRRP